MDRFYEVLPIIAPVFVALFLGYLSKRRNIISHEGIEGMKSLVMNFALPAVMIGAFYNIDVEANMLIVVGTMFLCGLLGLLAGKLIKKFILKKQELLPFIVTSYETGMIGYGLYLMLFPAEHLSNFALIDLGEALFVFTIYINLLNARKGMGKKESLKDMLKTPITWALIIGIILGASGLGRMLDASPVGPAVAETLNYIGAPVGILMLFVVGYGLNFKREYMKDAALTALIRLVIMLGLFFVATAITFSILPVSEYLFWGFALVFALPGPFIIPLFVKNEKESAYVSTSLALYTVITIILFTIIVFAKTSGAALNLA